MVRANFCRSSLQLREHARESLCNLNYCAVASDPNYFDFSLQSCILS